MNKRRVFVSLVTLITTRVPESIKKRLQSLKPDRGINMQDAIRACIEAHLSKLEGRKK